MKHRHLNQNIRATRLAEAPRHRRPTGRILVHILHQVLLTEDLDSVRLDGEIAAEDTAGGAPAVAAVAEVAPSLAGEEIGVVDFDGDQAAEAVAFHG
jgi:hypothetical protein